MDRKDKGISVGINLANRDFESYLNFWYELALKYDLTLTLVNHLDGKERIFNPGFKRKLRLIYPHPIDLIYLGRLREIPVDDLLCDYLFNYNSQINTSVLLGYRRYMQVYDIDIAKDKDLNRTRAVANIILNTNGWSN